jgi:hypothetical protein
VKKRGPRGASGKWFLRVLSVTGVGVVWSASPRSIPSGARVRCSRTLRACFPGFVRDGRAARACRDTRRIEHQELSPDRLVLPTHAQISCVRDGGTRGE